MKADHSESDRIVSISRIEPLLSRQLPRVTKATRSDKDVVAKATITHSESGVKEKKTERQLLRDLSKLEPKIRKGKRNGKKTAGRGPTVDTSRAKASGDVVRLAVRELGWREFSSGRRTGCDFYWLGGLFEMPEIPERGQLSKFVGMSEASRKVELTKQLNRLHFLFPHEFSFYPKTWTLPEQYSELLGYMSKVKTVPTFILKPDGGSQGDGIVILQNIYDVHLSTALVKPSVIQEYVADPYLLEKFKFDLRIYVVMKSLEPLQVYICREGMARFCTEHYQRPTPSNIHRAYMHLTNYSLNKLSPGYVQSDAGDKGTKRKLSAVFKQLKKQGCDTQKLWAEIDKVACKTIIALVPLLKLHSQLMSLEIKQELKAFQILGFDILLDKDLKPILLEVNSSPSLRIDYEEEISPSKVEYFVSATDMDIKLPIVKDSLLLSWQHRNKNDDNLPEVFGCLEQIYPKLAPVLDHLRIIERCLSLFRQFVGIRATDRMGPTSFRMMARRCRLTVFGFSLAAFEIMFINMTRRHSTCESGRASLDFNGFCESLIAIGQRKLALNMRREPVHILLTVLKHCEEQLGKTLEMSSYRQIVEPLTPPSGQNLRSCFHLPTRTAIK